MNEEEATTICAGRHLTLRSINGWEFVERNRVSGIVAVQAITEERKLLLVEQFRAPVNRRVIEIPAGLAGDIEGEEDEALVLKPPNANYSRRPVTRPRKWST
jgi:ADP-ribose pyrophosphatase